MLNRVFPREVPNLFRLGAPLLQSPAWGFCFNSNGIHYINGGCKLRLCGQIFNANCINMGRKLPTIAAIIARIVLIAIGNPVNPLSQNNSCIENYSSLEAVVLQNPENVVVLQNAFFPTDRQASMFVSVIYCFPSNGETSSISELNDLAQKCDYLAGIDGYGNVTCIMYHWMGSPISLFIRPELLRFLSLMTYQVEVRSAVMCIEKPLCPTKERPILCGSDPYVVCKDADFDGPKHLFNNFTTNVS